MQLNGKPDLKVFNAVINGILNRMVASLVRAAVSLFFLSSELAVSVLEYQV